MIEESEVMTIGYYDRLAKAFVNRTLDRDMSLHRGRFLQCLLPKAHLLDAGCGSGRDAQAFLLSGYQVTAFDASKELAKIAESVTGQNVMQMRFQDLHFVNVFDGIWANASLLHVSYDELHGVLRRLYSALKPSGILYASFKQGKKHRQVEDRHFYDQDQETLEPFLHDLFACTDSWNSEDTGVAANDSKLWFHVLLKKSAVK